ncbi:hypothetical protein K5Z09_005178 [Escherichia coli]|nr:hypothetical protein [Escherichia coli]EHR8683652.1 hypothetical protein [Escherichia coli]EHR8987834.1 hypothetical protein [Escherichia coli]EIM2921393.1 hypothetical protein [Escherichia coli]EIM2936203.1 hypothetical protein [Escherichia coli]
MRLLAHSLATLGHEAAAGTTTAIMRKDAPLQDGTEKIARKHAAQKIAKKALLSDIGYFPLFQFRIVRSETPNISAIAF